MSVSKKFVVCLAFLLTLLAGLAAGLLARPLPALAVWGDNNEPLPVLFGLQLGDDFREHPDWEREDPESLPHPKDWYKEATYEGIPVKPIGYGTFDHKIAAIDFFIKVKDFPRFRKLMRRKFGNEILRSDKDYK